MSKRFPSVPVRPYRLKENTVRYGRKGVEDPPLPPSVSGGPGTNGYERERTGTDGAPLVAVRPYRLALAEADAAHAASWADAAVARFLARVAAIRRRGFVEQDAADLAEQLHLLDVQTDGRSLCLSCRHLSGTTASGWRCNNHRAAEVARDLPADFVVSPQRCPGCDVVPVLEAEGGERS